MQKTKLNFAAALIIAAAFLLINLGIAEASSIYCTDGNDPPASGDWVINNTTVCTDGLPNLNGNLTIASTGNATFMNSTVRFNIPFNGSTTLLVESGGAFYFTGTDSCGYCSLIESSNPNYHYFFKVRSNTTFFVNQTKIKDVGTNSSEAELDGIYIATDNAEIINSNISFNVWGINLDNSSFSTIKNNQFQNNQEGALSAINFSSYNTIENNTFVSQQLGIDLAYQTGYNSVRYNNITSSGIYGILITGSTYNNITFNNIYSNVDGIFIDTSGADPSTNNISYNNIYSNSGYNINNQQTANITAEFNWWGTTNCGAINVSIFDYYDNSSFGIVDFEPFLNDSYPNGQPMNCPAPGGGGPQPPIVNITAPANNTKTNDNTPTITFYFTDLYNATGQATLYFNWTNVSYNGTAQNNTLTDLIPSSSQADGNWTFWVNVTTWAGNNSSLSYDILIDTTPPAITIVPPTDTNTTITRNWSYVNITLNEPGGGAIIEINDTNFTLMQGTTDKEWYRNFTQSGEGNLTYRFFANDSLGNTGLTGYSWTYVDSVPPGDIQFINDISNGTTWIFWDWSYASPSDFNHFEIWLNGTFKENKTTVTYNATGLSASTGYEIQVRPVDDVGNIGNWTNDTAFTQSSGGGGGNPPGNGGGGGGGGAGISTSTNVSNKTNPQARVPGVSQQINKTITTPSGLIINLSKEFGVRGLIKLELKVGDIIQVEIAKEPHTITVEKINAKNKTVTLIIRSTPTEVNLKESGSVLVDVDGDGKYDIKIIIDRVDGEKTTVILQDLKVEREQNPTAFITLTQGQVGILGIIAGAAIFATFVYWHVRRNKTITTQDKSVQQQSKQVGR